MRILTDPLNSHIEKIAKAQNIPIHWWPSVDGGTDGAKQKYVQEKYATDYKGKDNHVYCILTDNEPSQTFACRELTSKTGKKFERLYKCRKPVKQYYIYFHDSTLGGYCYLKISSYLPFQCEFYLNGHNAIALQLDQKKIQYKLHGNAIVDIDNPDAIAEAVKSLTGRMVFDRHLSDCPRPLPRFSAGGTTPRQHPRPSGGFTITMPAPNTASEAIPSSSTTKPASSFVPKPPSTTPNRWG